MESANSVLDEFSEFSSILHSVGDTLDDNAVLTLNLTGKEVVSSSEIFADTSISLDSDFILWKSVYSLLYSFVLICHL
jgi:hypothetical protein